MKKLSAIILVSMFLAGCGTLGKVKTEACMFEDNAHAFYVTFIAPFRPADKVAKEAALYAKIVAACAIGSSITSLQSQSATARQ